MKRVGLFMIVLALAVFETEALWAQKGGQNGQGQNGQGGQTQSVPEPATLLLLGSAAAAMGARKLWQARRRSRSKPTEIA